MNAVTITDLGLELKLDYGGGLSTIITKSQIRNYTPIVIPDCTQTASDTYHTQVDLDQQSVIKDPSYLNISQHGYRHEEDIKLYPAQVNGGLATLGDLVAYIQGIVSSVGSKQYTFTASGTDPEAFDVSPYFNLTSNVIVFNGGSLMSSSHYTVNVAGQRVTVTGLTGGEAITIIAL